MRQKSKKKKENIWVFHTDEQGVLRAVSHCKFVHGNPDIPGSEYIGRLQFHRDKVPVNCDRMVKQTTRINSCWRRCTARDFEEFMEENIDLFL